MRMKRLGLFAIAVHQAAIHFCRAEFLGVHLRRCDQELECADKLKCKDEVTITQRAWTKLYEEVCKLSVDIENAWKSGTENGSLGALVDTREIKNIEFKDWFAFAASMQAPAKEDVDKEADDPFATNYKLNGLIHVKADDQTHAQSIWLSELDPKPTFYGNYPPPDNLDGQVIDLAASTKGAEVKAPSSLTGSCVNGKLLSVEEVHKKQGDNRTTANILGPEVLSDHMPTFFDIKFGDVSFTGMEYNMLAQYNIPNGYYNAEPTRHTHLWRFILALSEAWDPKKLPDEWHVELKTGPVFRPFFNKVWATRKRVATEAFGESISKNNFVEDVVRQKHLGEILKRCAAEEGDALPDIIFLVEFGFPDHMRDDYEGLKALTDLGYRMVTVDPRRYTAQHLIQWRDSALILVRSSLNPQALPFHPPRYEEVAECPDLTDASERNRGKPMAGVKLKLSKGEQTQEGILIALHADKLQTEAVVKMIVTAINKCPKTHGSQRPWRELPLVIAGDFNGMISERGP